MSKHMRMVNLEQEHIDWLESRAELAGVSPSALVRQLVSRAMKRPIDPVALLVDICGLYCYSMIKEPSVHSIYPHRRVPSTRKGQGSLCMEPAVVVTHNGGEWIPFCTHHRPLESIQESYDVADEVRYRLGREMPA